MRDAWEFGRSYLWWNSMWNSWMGEGWGTAGEGTVYAPHVLSLGEDLQCLWSRRSDETILSSSSGFKSHEKARKPYSSVLGSAVGLELWGCALPFTAAHAPLLSLAEGQ